MGSPAGLIPLVQKPGIPCLKSRKGEQELREQRQLNAWHKQLHRTGQLPSVSGHYCHNGQGSDELQFAILTVLL